MIRMITYALLVLFLALGCASAQSPIRELMATEANISKLDWIFLNAEIESLNIHPSMELGRFYYDPSTDRIVATVRVTPSWLESASLDTAKRDLQSAAIMYQVNAFIQDQTLDDAWLPDEEFEHFYVEFRTFDSKAKFRTFAVFENGELILK